MSLLTCDHVSYGYIDGNKKRMILNDLSYTFEQGKLYTILVPSGSGKTTLLSLIGALEKTQEGVIAYNGVPIEKIGYTTYRKNYQALVFQQFNLIPYLNALENVVNVMHISDNDIPKPYEQTALALLAQLGITKTKATRKINQLSGGEQQRVAIARALATNVKLILADEPTGNLDDETTKEIIQVFKKLAHQYQACIILVTHSNEVAKVSDVSLQLKNGKLVNRHE